MDFSQHGAPHAEHAQLYGSDQEDLENSPTTSTFCDWSDSPTSSLPGSGVLQPSALVGSEHVVMEGLESMADSAKPPLRSCGLVALTIAAEYFGRLCKDLGFHGKDERALTETASLFDQNLNALLSLSIHLNMSSKGELFSADWIAQLARVQFGLTAMVIEWNGEYPVVECLQKGGLCLVAYDKEGNHEPGLKKGGKAHWALINGTAPFDSTVDASH
ncbi:hypothetical protein HDU98_007624 [Podochytrium sp. JEL0797]|nr:hypothetical protein HDU98_007624 [Podochytrium sp. JEL0797]